MYIYYSTDTILSASSDITLQCNPFTNRMLFVYDISVLIGLDSAFTPTVLEAVELHISRLIVDENGNLVFADGIFNFEPIIDVNNETSISDRVLPLMGSGRQYQYVVRKLKLIIDKKELLIFSLS